MTTHDMPRFADITTLHVGGALARLYRPKTHEELLSLLQQCYHDQEEYLLLGGGSNVVASDEPYQGSVIVPVCNTEPQVTKGEQGIVEVVAQAGCIWDDLVSFSVEQGFAGLEALSGIPGSVGAAPIQNIGAYGSEVVQVIDRIEVYDRHKNTLSWRPYRDFCPTYRHSLLKADPTRFVVTQVCVRLVEQRLSMPIAYAQLAEYLGVQAGQSAELTAVREAVLSLRASKGMVYDEDDHDTWSCGSFFTNPIVPIELSCRVPDCIPRYPISDAALVKLSAAALIEHAGCNKGSGIPNGNGRATLSTKHVLALTNRGDARAQDIVDLAYFVQRQVFESFGITLSSEPVGIGLQLP